MKLQHVPVRILKKLFTHSCRFVGRDSITFTRIISRHDLQEIGSKKGGWIVPGDLLDANSICYCVGCGEDISFDLGLIGIFGCHVHGFDPTPRAIQHVKEHAGQNDRYHFSEIGLWYEEDTLKFFVPQNPRHVSHSLLNLQKTEEYIEVKVKRLKHVMEENAHDKLDLLKLDIEGAEYKVIDSIVEDRIDINILCVEFDECFHALDGDYRARIMESICKLLDLGYSLVCTQGRGNYTFVKQA